MVPAVQAEIVLAAKATKTFDEKSKKCSHGAFRHVGSTAEVQNNWCVITVCFVGKTLMEEHSGMKGVVKQKVLKLSIFTL